MVCYTGLAICQCWRDREQHREKAFRWVVVGIKTPRGTSHESEMWTRCGRDVDERWNSTCSPEASMPSRHAGWRNVSQERKSFRLYCQPDCRYSFLIQLGRMRKKRFKLKLDLAETKLIMQVSMTHRAKIIQGHLGPRVYIDGPSMVTLCELYRL